MGGGARRHLALIAQATTCGIGKSRAIEERLMLHYAIVFLVIAIIAAVLGFGGIAGTAAGIAKILFVVFLVLAAISFFRGRKV